MAVPGPVIAGVVPVVALASVVGAAVVVVPGAALALVVVPGAALAPVVLRLTVLLGLWPLVTRAVALAGMTVAGLGRRSGSGSRSRGSSRRLGGR
jgi:hypothetical protein